MYFFSTLRILSATISRIDAGETVHSGLVPDIPLEEQQFIDMIRVSEWFDPTKHFPKQSKHSWSASARETDLNMRGSNLDEKFSTIVQRKRFTPTCDFLAKVKTYDFFHRCFSERKILNSFWKVWKSQKLKKCLPLVSGRNFCLHWGHSYPIFSSKIWIF